jgi:hypothetical protein
MSDGEDQPRENLSAEIPAERVAYYQARAQELLDTHSRLFDEFTRSQPELVRLGDTKLRSAQATGYNILLVAAAMPLDTNEQLIFYNNYIGRPEHFGMLLAAMEHEGLITESETRLGVKASKVVNTGAWQPETADETVEEIMLAGPHTPDAPVRAQASKTVETVVTFLLRKETHAQDVVEFLLAHTTARTPLALEGSWEAPDVRATANLSAALAGTGKFALVRANVYGKAETPARLLVLRSQTRFKGRWRSAQMEVNEKLALYIASPALGVEP